MIAALTEVEQEVIILKTIWDLIDDMVNYTLFQRLTKTDDVTLNFHDSVHARLFNILLVDFLSLPSREFTGLPSPPKGANETNRSLLFHLSRVCERPQLNPGGALMLRAALEDFTGWLEDECHVPRVWLSSIEVEVDIRVKRITFIKICGNIAKHSAVRLNADAKAICGILEFNGKPITMDQAYLALPDFFEWFHRDILIYHSSTIAEFLNTIRREIFSYLRPEFFRSFTRDDPSSVAYHYRIPPECGSKLTETIYWDLMNAVRSEPYIPRYKVTPWLKLRY
jgi:hypothetical protein